MAKTLDQIVSAIRLGEPVSYDDAVYAIVAFDVLLAQLELEKTPEKLQHYFVAAELPPAKYIGPNNDPKNPEALAWYRAMQGVTEKPSCYGKRFGNEACFHTCPYSEGCYSDD